MTDSEGDRPVWTSVFNEETRAEQVAEDSAAWHAVTGLLLAIITAGVCLAIFTAWICS